MQDAERLCRLNRYTGSGDGEAAAEQIAERMEDLGIRVDRERYQMYRSLPGKASLRILGAGQEEDIPLTPYVYSGTAKDLEAELVFDGISAAGGCSQREQRARMAGFSGKLVLTYENSFSFACEAKRAGALGYSPSGMRTWRTTELWGESGGRRSRRIWPGIIRGSRLRRSERPPERSCGDGWRPGR